ncbi:DUF2339 domain-containing protein [Pararhodobacter sp. CCB-MM2]|uniref:DUF2339 domain-containing protein n=1 Tax=Pararhodobacter sp. CCB-MM2 TaxID=1786003 RepID=UPI000833F675|nr:DUF2339 domain-containing protein [Pararhodobacter sp. CCB-MM2]
MPLMPLSVLLALIIGAVIVLFRRERALMRRVTALEARLAGQGDPLPEAGTEAEPVATAPSGPWKPKPRVAEDPTPEPTPKGPGVAARFLAWMQTNWIYPVAGAALVMAGVYLVQYSIEAGLLSPAARIALALVLGAVLILGGELLRRRWGGDEGAAGLVPATLAGAGIATLFAAVLAAFHLYQMLGQTTALAALAAVACLSMALGWGQGPLLAAIGVIAASAAPFLLGPGGGPTSLLYAYFGAVALLGLGIDAFRRWFWVSALALLLPLIGACLIRIAGAGPEGLALLALLLIFAGTALPGGALMPRNTGAAPFARTASAPTRLAALAVIAPISVLLTQVEAPHGLLALGLAVILLPIWTRYAPALDILYMITAAALPVAILLSPMVTPLMLSMTLNTQPWLPLWVIVAAILGSLSHLWRSESTEGRPRLLWTLGGAFLPLATAVATEVTWQPSTLLGGTWPLLIMAAAAVLTAAATLFAKCDGGQGERVGLCTAAVFPLIALALMLILSETALTVALGVLVLAAALMDRKLDIPALGWVVGAGAMALGWRLLLDPGIEAFLTGRIDAWNTVLTLFLVLGAPLGALVVVASRPIHPWRNWGAVVTETALGALAPVALLILLARFLPSLSGHAITGIEACALILSARVQHRRNARLSSGRVMRWVRTSLTGLLGLAGGLLVVALLTLASPVWGLFSDDVSGWPLINDLLLAYAAPAFVLHLTLRGTRWQPVALLPGALWLGYTIRHLWQGGTRMEMWHGVQQGELYAYTLALLAMGAVSIGLALRTRIPRYRRIGLALIGLAAAKAFLVDASGLSGLVRVGGFLGLGLSLAGLAWLNAWVSKREKDGATTD